MSTTLAQPVTTGRQLSQAELRAVVAQYAAEVRRRAHVAEFRTDERWHVRIHQDADVDVWLISWTTEQGTELQDHGGSSGAFTVVDGTLAEYVWAGARPDAKGRLERHRRRRGRTVSFGPDYVHDVRNHKASPAVSVHVYSPPIHLMHFYDASEGTLLRWASSWIDDPEAPAPAREPAYASVDDLLAAARAPWSGCGRPRPRRRCARVRRSSTSARSGSAAPMA